MAEDEGHKGKPNTGGENGAHVFHLPHSEFLLQGQDAVEAHGLHEVLRQALQDLGQARLDVLRGQAPLIKEVEAAARATEAERKCQLGLKEIACRYGADFNTENWTFQSKTMKFTRTDIPRNDPH